MIELIKVSFVKKINNEAFSTYEKIARLRETIKRLEDAVKESPVSLDISGTLGVLRMDLTTEHAKFGRLCFDDAQRESERINK